MSLSTQQRREADGDHQSDPDSTTSTMSAETTRRKLGHVGIASTVITDDSKIQGGKFTSASDEHGDSFSIPIPTSRAEIQGTHRHDPHKEDKMARAQIAQTLREKHLLQFVVSLLIGVLLCGYFFVVPFILCSIYYISWARAAESGICAIFIPVIMWVYEYSYYQRTDRSLSHTRTFHRFTNRSTASITLVSKQWIYEFYQLFVTVLSVCLWISYSYYLKFDGTDVGPAYGYSTTMPDISLFIQVEFFVVIALGLDWVFRYSISVSRKAFVTFYNVMDLIVFSAIAYFSFYQTDIIPSPGYTYDLYLLSGFFRILRLRRALFSLDHTVVVNGLKRHRLGPLLLSPYAARAVLLLGRVLIYLLASAAIIEFFEFRMSLPLFFATQALNNACNPNILSNGGECNTGFTEFHLVLYYTVVTLSTVGYGDMYAGTTGGRMIVIGIIFVAVINVPALTNDAGAIAADLQKPDKTEAKADNVGPRTKHTDEAENSQEHEQNDDNDFDDDAEDDKHDKDKEKHSEKDEKKPKKKDEDSAEHTSPDKHSKGDEQVYGSKSASTVRQLLLEHSIQMVAEQMVEHRDSREVAQLCSLYGLRVTDNEQPLEVAVKLIRHLTTSNQSDMRRLSSNQGSV